MARPKNPPNPNRMKPRNYTIEEKLLVVEMVRRANGKVSKKLFEQIKEAINAPMLDLSSVYRWNKELYDVSAKVVQTDTMPTRTDRGRFVFLREVKVPEGTKVRDDDKVLRVIDDGRRLTTINLTADLERADKAITDMFRSITQRYLEHALKPEVIEKLGGKDAVMAANTAAANLKARNALPDDVMAILPDLIGLMKAKNIDPAAIFYKMYQELQRSTGG